MLCLSAGALTTALALNAFTLTWIHSAQKSEIQEDWRILGDRLTITETRIKGSAAGYDPPPDAVLAGGWWHYDPHLPPLPEVRLARSGAVAGWQLCANGACRPINDYLLTLPPDMSGAQEPILLRACAATP